MAFFARLDRFRRGVREGIRAQPTCDDRCGRSDHKQGTRGTCLGSPESI
jgi:hypothetical protein